MQLVERHTLEAVRNLQTQRNFEKQYACLGHLAQDFVGHDKTDSECATMIDELYLRDTNFKLYVVDHQGHWKTKRGRGKEQRYNRASVLSRRGPIENIGLLTNIRQPPWHWPLA